MSSIFYGAKVQENKPEVPRITQAAALRITRVSLNPENSGNRKTSLFIKIKNNSFCIATLQKDKIEDKPLDIYLANSEVVTFYAKGKGELHLIGYFDPLDFDSQNAFDQGEEEDEEDETEGLDLNPQELLKQIANSGKVKTLNSYKKKDTNPKPSTKKSQNKVEDKDDEDDDDDDDEDDDYDDEDQDFQLEDIDSSDQDLGDSKNLEAEAKKSKSEFRKEDKKVQNQLKRAKDNKISNANIPRVVSRNNSAKKTKAQQLSSGSEDLLNDVSGEDEDEEDSDEVKDEEIDKVISEQLLHKRNLKVENFEVAKKGSTKKKQIGKEEDQSEALDDLLNDQDDLPDEQDLLKDLDKQDQDLFNDLDKQDQDLLNGLDKQDQDLLNDLDKSDQDLFNDLDKQDQDLLNDLDKQDHDIYEEDFILNSENDSALQDDDQIIKGAAKQSKTLGKFRKAVIQEKHKSNKEKKTENGTKVGSSTKGIFVDATKKNLPAEKKNTSSKPIIGLFAQSKRAESKKEVEAPSQIFKDSGQGKKKKKRNKKKNKN